MGPPLAPLALIEPRVLQDGDEDAGGDGHHTDHERLDGGVIRCEDGPDGHGDDDGHGGYDADDLR